MVDRSAQVKALASEVRMEILKLLKRPGVNFPDQESADPDEVGVCMHMIADRLRVSAPTVTRHIDLLRQAGFVSVRRQHRWSYVSRIEDALADYHDWIGREILSKP